MHGGVAWGHRVLPWLRRGHQGPEAAGVRSHVAMCELVPCLREGGGEKGRVAVEALGYRGVGRIETEGEVGGEHDRGVPLGGIESSTMSNHTFWMTAYRAAILFLIISCH